MEAVFVALITGGLSLAGVIITTLAGQRVTKYQIEELTREVRKHNDFARRIPVLEEKIAVANHRIEDLERSEK